MMKIVWFTCLLVLYFTPHVLGSTVTEKESVKEVIAIIPLDAEKAESVLYYEGKVYYHFANASEATEGAALIGTGALPVSKAESDLAIITGGTLECTSQVVPYSATFWQNVFLCMGLVLFGGLMSGLTVGLFSLDPLKLELILKDKNHPQNKDAVKLAPIVSNHHRLLVTLLLANAAAMEALPLFLDVLVPEWLAIVLSVSFVLIFGEVLPQAICTKNPLKIGATFSIVVQFLMLVSSPIVIPIAWLLDRILGHHESKNMLFKRSELKALVDLHINEKDLDAEKNQAFLSEKKEDAELEAEYYQDMNSHLAGRKSALRSSQQIGLSNDEARVINGVLDIKKKRAFDVMTSFDLVFSLDRHAKIDSDLFFKIAQTGFSRVPVYDGNPHNIKGVLITKHIMVIKPEDNKDVGDMPMMLPLFIPSGFPVMNLLHHFQTGNTHFAFVTDNVHDYKVAMTQKRALPGYAKILGIITLEDIIEEFMGEIWDEGDIQTGSHKQLVARASGKQPNLRNTGLAKTGVSVDWSVFMPRTESIYKSNLSPMEIDFSRAHRDEGNASPMPSMTSSPHSSPNERKKGHLVPLEEVKEETEIEKRISYIEPQRRKSRKSRTRSRLNSLEDPSTSRSPMQSASLFATQVGPSKTNTSRHSSVSPNAGAALGPKLSELVSSSDAEAPSIQSTPQVKDAPQIKEEISSENNA